MSGERIPPSQWPTAGQVVLELGVTLSTYIGTLALLGSIIYIFVHRVFVGSPALSDPKTWIFPLMSLGIALVGEAIIFLSWRFWGRRRE
jgi:hypothetical protein